jgi:hypothetical protein
LGDLAVMLADGAERLRDLAGPRDQPGLLGPIASTQPPGWWNGSPLTWTMGVGVGSYALKHRCAV